MTVGDPKNLDRLERALQASLRPVDPGADFTAGLVARLAMAPAQVVVPIVARPAPQRRWYSASL